MMGLVEHGEVTMDMKNDKNIGYAAEFYLGTGKPQKIRAMFDTGSANSWVLTAEAA